MAEEAGRKGDDRPQEFDTPATARPTSLNGSNRSQTIGYSTSAMMAIGQHNTRRMHQSRNFTTSLTITNSRQAQFLRADHL